MPPKAPLAPVECARMVVQSRAKPLKMTTWTHSVT